MKDDEWQEAHFREFKARMTFLKNGVFEKC